MDESAVPVAETGSGTDQGAWTDHTAAPSQAQLERSQSAIRDTTKWLVAAAAAVGAVVVAGLQLSHLPYGTLATSLAIGGFLVAIVGVAIVLLAASVVLSAGYTTLGELADLYGPEAERKELDTSWQEKDDELAQARQNTRNLLLRPVLDARLLVRRMLRPVRIRLAKEYGIRNAEMIEFLEKDAVIFTNYLAATIPELYGLIQQTDREILERRGEVAALSKRSSQSARPAGKSRRLADLEWRAAQLKMGAGQLIAFANQLVVERRFQALKRAVQYGGAAVLAGVGAFALAPKLAQERPLQITAPTKVVIVVKKPAAFGKQCTVSRLDGVAIGGNWDEPLVITTAAGNCGVTRLVLTSNIGLATPAQN